MTQLNKDSYSNLRSMPKQRLAEFRGRFYRNPGMGMYTHCKYLSRIVDRHDIYIFGIKVYGWNVWHLARRKVNR